MDTLIIRDKRAKRTMAEPILVPINLEIGSNVNNLCVSNDELNKHPCLHKVFYCQGLSKGHVAMWIF